jgi:hypothetical protein
MSDELNDTTNHFFLFLFFFFLFFLFPSPYASVDSGVSVTSWLLKPSKSSSMVSDFYSLYSVEASSLASFSFTVSDACVTSFETYSEGSSLVSSTIGSETWDSACAFSASIAALKFLSASCSASSSCKASSLSLAILSSSS